MSSTRRTRTLALPTLAVHAGEPAHDVDSPVATPLHQSTSFVQEVGTAEGLLYPRYGNTPNAEVVQKKLAALERAEAGVVLSSGMGATACALMAQRVDAIVAGKAPELVWLLEHPPLYTAGTSARDADLIEPGHAARIRYDSLGRPEIVADG